MLIELPDSLDKAARAKRKLPCSRGGRRKEHANRSVSTFMAILEGKMCWSHVMGLSEVNTPLLFPVPDECKSPVAQ